MTRRRTQILHYLVPKAPMTVELVTSMAAPITLPSGVGTVSRIILTVQPRTRSSKSHAPHDPRPRTLPFGPGSSSSHGRRSLTWGDGRALGHNAGKLARFR